MIHAGGTRESLGDDLSLGSGLLGLLLLSVLGEELLVLLNILAGGLVAVDVIGLDGVLAAETGLGDETLDLGGLVVGLVLALDLTGNNVLADVVLFLVKVEGLDDVVATLGSELVGTVDVGDTGDLGVSLLHNTEEDGSEVVGNDAAADGLSLALTSAGGLVTGLACNRKVIRLVYY